LNLVYPQSVPKINKPGIVAMERENVGNYVKACARLGFNKSNLFESNDLFEGKNLTKVVENVFELAHFGSRKDGLPKIEKKTSKQATTKKKKKKKKTFHLVHASVACLSAVRFFLSIGLS